MVTKVHLDALKGEAASVQGLLARLGDRDILSSISLRQRLTQLQEEIARYERELPTQANVALIFDGEPVEGSQSIDADFAGKALQTYQDLLTKQVAVASGELRERGRLPQQAHDAARMHVTSLVHGSFGFVLQEAGSEQAALFESPAKAAVREVSNLLRTVSAPNEGPFEQLIEELDERVFSTLKRFVGIVFKGNATMRVAERDVELRLDPGSLERAYQRLSATDVSESEDVVVGELLGLVPIQRRFDFRSRDNGQVITGRVSQLLSAGYLERIENEGLIAGREWRARIITKVVEHADGRHLSTHHTLVDLVEV